MGSKFFSLSSALAMSGHPVAAQGRDGGPYSVRSVAIIYDRSRSLFQAVFFEDGLDAERLARDVERAGYLLHTVIPLSALDDPDPGDYPVMRELRTSAQKAQPSAAQKAQPSAAQKAQPSARKARKAVDARARAEEAVELLRQLMVL